MRMRIASGEKTLRSHFCPIGQKWERMTKNGHRFSLFFAFLREVRYDEMLKKTMRPFILAILIGSFVGIALFGFAAASCVPGIGPHCCIADAISGADCPANDPVAFINFHFNFLKDYSKAVLGYAPLSSVFLASLLFLLAVKMRIASDKKAGALAVTHNPFDRRRTKSASPLERSIARWLALREIRDPHALAWAHDLPTAPRFGSAW